jgi:hypothetical protein
VQGSEKALSPGNLLVPFPGLVAEEKREQQLENNRGIMFSANVTPSIHER